MSTIVVETASAAISPAALRWLEQQRYGVGGDRGEGGEGGGDGHPP
ncbi:hypothetical protein [Streptomyces griseiscabiei]|uniref:Uncharacterized protein n=1 Tax=Streptomyces griseiscabiei TaxID=2993540 RepID=A0ABU4L7Q1_9ACTN|nr:hypothetical protein [Streptomyces griseiscabiei]MDX2911500.1 hypothetical protein [Streptomyces griseiscabiei]